MIELLLPCGFDTLQYSWVKATINICTITNYSVAKKRQPFPFRRWSRFLISQLTPLLSRIEFQQLGQLPKPITLKPLIVSGHVNIHQKAENIIYNAILECFLRFHLFWGSKVQVSQIA
jgi:hypothetical protein